MKAIGLPPRWWVASYQRWQARRDMGFHELRNEDSSPLQLFNRSTLLRFYASLAAVALAKEATIQRFNVLTLYLSRRSPAIAGRTRNDLTF